MGRLFGLAFSGAMCAAAVAQASTVESFSVAASARITLVSATFEDGSDALGALSVTYSLDLFDDFPESSGDATVNTSFTRDDGIGLWAVATDGQAGPATGSSKGDVQGQLAQIFQNTSASSIKLVFDYAISGSGSASGGVSDYDFDAFVALATDDNEVFREGVDLFSTPPSATGTTDWTVGAGDKFYAFSSAEVFGTAFVFDPAPVPLPATLPLLAGTLAGVAGWRRIRTG